MKKLVLFAAVASLVLASCAGNPEGKKAEATDSVAVADSVAGNTYTVDTTQSQLVWKGTKVTGAHEGTVAIKSGSLFVDNGAITGGNFVLDMNTISSTDLDGEYKEKLDGHLKADDFFAVATFPEASFQITEVKAGATANDVVISGNLTIKGISKNITFDAKVDEVSDSVVKSSADFNIAREDWGVTYEGKKDDLISKEINFKVTIVANK
ncbi:YceI family protein [Sphingobacterium litopenaei]|uniref:YceI family protein n=1 Tax=Sphingobacterium litopenaei TaxID=2763500 RepID=A0ABR7Y9U5_9SPHI|nr:YceI family protein [Sphingobacterium litopenaei]MBD1428072.1 YceI family protein [Sphingobacterium litopenaei]